AGSAGLDLATAHTVTLLDSSVHLLSTDISGPLPPKMQALLLGRSSTTLTGLFVLPGVIDADSTNEIKIMAWTPFPPCTVPRGSRIAQLVLIPKEVCSLVLNQPHQQRQGGFGSTGDPQILWVQSISQKRPICQCTLVRGGQQVVLSGIIDTGADVTVIS
ncbi:POK9 protein, partial [Alopecoenas beccarii]|nr:POK9 protein [Alopecoenas beccarii]